MGNIAARVHALHEYSANDVLFDHSFADVTADADDGMRVIDLTRFHEAIPSEC